jgi:serine/threonine protein phosphatase PrpC
MNALIQTYHDITAIISSPALPAVLGFLTGYATKMLYDYTLKETITNAKQSVEKQMKPTQIYDTFSINKNPEYSNDDAYKIVKTENGYNIAVADGVSNSRWAKVCANSLVNVFASNGITTTEGIIQFQSDIVNGYYNNIPKESIERIEKEYSKETLLDFFKEGGKATIASIQIEDNRLQYIVIGDTAIFHIRNGQLIHNLQRKDENNCPDKIRIYCDTENQKTLEICDNGEKNNILTGDIALKKGDYICIATDGFSGIVEDYVQNGKIDDLAKLFESKNQEEIKRIREEGISKRFVDRDDSTCVFMKI